MIAPQQKSIVDGQASSTIKFLCSYGGRILPRPSDGCLRYVGGQTRVLSVDRSVSYSELISKLGDLCGGGHSSDVAVTLRCQLPTEDMDVLVTVRSDEDLANVVEEYRRVSLSAGKELKVRAILSPPKSANHHQMINSPPLSSSASSGADLSPTNSTESCSSPRIVFRPRPVVGSGSGPGTPRRFKYDVAWNQQYRPCHFQANYRNLQAGLVSNANYRQ